MIGSIVGVYVSLQTRIKALEIRVEQREKTEDRVMTKLDHISEDINDIKIELQNKQNRQ